MSNTDPNAGTEPKAPEGVKPGEQQSVAKTFTQEEFDRLIQERLAQQAKNKFGDYEDLKAKAGESQTLEQRVADMELRAKAAEATALRSNVAAEFGISTKKGPNGEPSDADLFLTGSDADTLTAQAKRLAARDEDRKKQGNFAPKEGSSPSNSGSSDDLRDFAKKLFNKE